MFDLKTNVLAPLVILTQVHLSFAGTQVDRVTSQERLIKQAVESFYKSYIADVSAYLDSPTARTRHVDPSSFVLTRSRYFTKEFLQVYKKLVKDPDLDHDPIVQSNDIPNELRTTQVRLKGSTAYVYMEYVGYPSDTPLLEVRLKKRNGKWLIDAIGDINKNQPGGGIPADKVQQLDELIFPLPTKGNRLTHGL